MCLYEFVASMPGGLINLSFIYLALTSSQLPLVVGSNLACHSLTSRCNIPNLKFFFDPFITTATIHSRTGLLRAVQVTKLKTCPDMTPALEPDVKPFGQDQN